MNSKLALDNFKARKIAENLNKTKEELYLDLLKEKIKNVATVSEALELANEIRIVTEIYMQKKYGEAPQPDYNPKQSLR